VAEAVAPAFHLLFIHKKAQSIISLVMFIATTGPATIGHLKLFDSLIYNTVAPIVSAPGYGLDDGKAAVTRAGSLRQCASHAAGPLRSPLLWPPFLRSCH
jgi:hypothetical protein